MLKNLRIQKRLSISFILVSALASVAGIVGAVAMFYIAGQYDYALKNYGFSQGDIGKVMVTFADARGATRAVIGYTDVDIIKQAMDIHDTKKAKCQEYLGVMKQTLSSEEEQRTYESAINSIEKFWKMDAEIIELGNTTDVDRSLEAQKRAADELDPLYDECYSYLAELMNINVVKGNELQHSLSILRMVLLCIIIFVMVLAIISSIILGNTIAEGIAQPLHKLSERLKTFAAGNLSDAFPEMDTHDEVSDMIKVAKDMGKNLTLIIQDARYRLGEMAKGDYTVESSMSDKYVGEFTELNTAMRQMNINMNNTLHQIESASEQVSAGAGNLSDASQNLAEGATEQAGAVEELLATITSLTEGINNTSAGLEETYKVSCKNAQRANEGRQEMKGLVETMERISETSKRVGSIITEIEEIASQTNLLSLNASIEAARAGEAGKGFAVVADQIGKLADESAHSAVNTRELILNTISEIENGTIAAGKTAKTIEDVVEGMNHLADNAKGFSETSKVQAEAMKQGEAGVNQISEVIQANSATAQEASATSEELSAQAITLDELVKQFKLK